MTVKPYSSNGRRRVADARPGDGAGPPRASPRDAGPPRPSPRDRLALYSLAVAALATVASVAQGVLAYRTVDAPYRALVYQEQVRRSVETVDFIAALKADVERWEAMRSGGVMDAGAVLPEIRQRMRRFAELSQATWPLTERSQHAIGAAASDFNRFAVRCLVPRYAGTGESAAAGGCDRLFAGHERSALAASDSILADISFARRKGG